MPQITTVLSPIFPPEKDADVSANAAPLKHTAHIEVFIKLVEPVVFLQGFESQHSNERPPAMLRGSLVVRILKPTKLKAISLTLKGYTRTEWPEGIPPKKQDFVDINDIVNHTWPFYEASNPISLTAQNNNADSENDILVNCSGASMYKPLSLTKSQRNTPSTSAKSTNKLTDFTSPLQLSPISSNNNINNTLKSVSSNTPKGEQNGSIRRSRANSSGASNIVKTSAAARSLSPLNLFKRVASFNHGSQKIENDKDNIRSANSAINNSARAATSTSIFSELLTSTFSNEASNPNNVQSQDSNPLNANDSFVFQPGDYVYTFEQIIPQSYPESIKADFGFIEYFLLATIERYGAFKSNLNARLPVTIIRTQSDTSVEESEPILISRDWEKQLFYDIIISSKDIILDAFLPINFSFSPLDKVTLHRVRIYITETMEYYCNGKKTHRLEPTKKFLLAEYCGPRLPNAPKDASATKAKYMGNLLEDSDGFLSNKTFEFQVFVPSRFGNHQRLHPDTGFDKIKSTHWIKLCLRLSKIIDGKRKHYEISIDSPIHVLHKLCSHANTLLPSYDSHFVNTQFSSSTSFSLNTSSLNGGSNDNNLDSDSISASAKSTITDNRDNLENMYHTSNIFFPKEVISSQILSPNVQPVDIDLMNGPSRTPLPRIASNRHQNSNNNNGNNQYIHNLSQRSNTNNSITTEEDAKDDIFASPKLKSNIYQPETIERALISPQAVPLSPITSPLLRPLSFFLNETDNLSINSHYEDDPPPEFNFDDKTPTNIRVGLNTTSYTSGSSNSKRNLAALSEFPPSYNDAINTKNIDIMSNFNISSSRLSKLTQNRSRDSLLFTMNRRKSNLNLDSELESSFVADKDPDEEEDDDEHDIASNFSFEGSSSQLQNLPAGILKSHPPKLRPLSTDMMFLNGRIENNSILPSTLRTDNQLFTDMNQIFSDNDNQNEQDTIPAMNVTKPNDHTEGIRHSIDFSNHPSIRSSRNIDKDAYLAKDSPSLEPLLKKSISGNRTLEDITITSFDNSFLRSGDLINELSEQPLDASVDITALYNRNTTGRSSFQFEDGADALHSTYTNQDSGVATDASSSRLSELATESEIKTMDTIDRTDQTTAYNDIET